MRESVLRTLLFAPETAVSGGGGTVDIRQAFRAAVQQHTGAGGTGDVVPAAETETEDEAEGAEAPATRTRRPATRKPAAPAPAESEEEGDEAEGEAAEEEEDTEETPPAAKVKPGQADTELISDTEFTALQTKYADDPVKLRKALLGQFTRKTQALAEQRRSVERLRSYAPLIESLEDPATAAETIRQLAADYGVEITPTRTAAEEPAPQPALGERIAAKVTEAMGTEYDYLSEPLAKVLTEVLSDLVPQEIDKAVKPLRGQAEAMLAHRAETLTNDAMRAFQDRHPDWQDVEPEMLALMQRVHPAGMTDAEYLDFVYDNVTRGDQDSRIEREVATRVKKQIAKMNGAEPGRRPNPTDEGDVRHRRPKNATIQDAFEAAKAGIRWEDPD